MRNVLFITIDCLAHRDVALLKETGKLCAQQLSSVYTVSGITNVSMASWFTTKYPIEHGVRQLDVEYKNFLPETMTTSKIFRTMGYKTFAFTAADFMCEIYGFGQGFDRYYYRWLPKDTIIDHKEIGKYPIGLIPAEKAIEVFNEWRLKQKHNWFAWLHLFDCHQPYGLTYKKTPDWFTHGNQRLEISRIDPLIAKLVSEVGDSVVIISSDHGETFPEDGRGRKDHSTCINEEIVHVPLMLVNHTIQDILYQTTDIWTVLMRTLFGINFKKSELVPNYYRNWVYYECMRKGWGIQGYRKRNLKYFTDGKYMIDLDNDPDEIDKIDSFEWSIPVRLEL